MSLDDFKRQALELQVDEREDVKHDRLWRSELENRYREYKEGKAELFDAEEVLAELRAEIGSDASAPKS